MADQGCLEILEEGPEAWNAWRTKNPSVRPDLSGVTICLEDSVGINLSFTNCRGSDLRESQFDSTKCDMSYSDFSGANLSGCGLGGVDFHSTNLSGAALFDCEMIFANLEGANLSGAMLSGSYFDGANLKGANLSDASLVRTHFKDNCMEGACLVRANLWQTSFHGAYLCDTDFCDSTMGATALGSIDLKGAKNLDRVTHRSHEAIGVDTLELTAASLDDDFLKRRIEIFLRGAGLSVKAIDFFRSL